MDRSNDSSLNCKTKNVGLLTKYSCAKRKYKSLNSKQKLSTIARFLLENNLSLKVFSNDSKCIERIKSIDKILQSFGLVRSAKNRDEINSIIMNHGTKLRYIMTGFNGKFEDSSKVHANDLAIVETEFGFNDNVITSMTDYSNETNNESSSKNSYTFPKITTHKDDNDLLKEVNIDLVKLENINADVTDKRKLSGCGSDGSNCFGKDNNFLGFDTEMYFSALTKNPVITQFEVSSSGIEHNSCKLKKENFESMLGKGLSAPSEGNTSLSKENCLKRTIIFQTDDQHVFDKTKSVDLVCSKNPRKHFFGALSNLNKLSVDEKVRRITLYLIENNISVEAITQTVVYTKRHKHLDNILKSFMIWPTVRTRMKMHKLIRFYAKRIQMRNLGLTQPINMALYRSLNSQLPHHSPKNIISSDDPCTSQVSSIKSAEDFAGTSQTLTNKIMSTDMPKVYSGRRAKRMYKLMSTSEKVSHIASILLKNSFSHEDIRPCVPNRKKTEPISKIVHSFGLVMSVKNRVTIQTFIRHNIDRIEHMVNSYHTKHATTLKLSHSETSRNCETEMMLYVTQKAQSDESTEDVKRHLSKTITNDGGVCTSEVENGNYKNKVEYFCGTDSVKGSDLRIINEVTQNSSNEIMSDNMPVLYSNRQPKKKYNSMTACEKATLIADFLLENNLSHKDIMPSASFKPKSQHISRIMTCFGLLISKNNRNIIQSLIKRQLNNIRHLVLSRSKKKNNVSIKGNNKEITNQEFSNFSKCTKTNKSCLQGPEITVTQSTSSLNAEETITNITDKSRKLLARMKFKCMSRHEKISHIAKVLLTNNLSLEDIMPSAPSKVKTKLINKIATSFDLVISNKNHCLIYSLLKRRMNDIKHEILFHLNKQKNFSVTSNDLSTLGEFQSAKVVAPLGSDYSVSEFNAGIENKPKNLSEKENSIKSIQKLLNSSQCNNINQSCLQESELKNTQSTSCTGFMTSENFALSESSEIANYHGLNDNCDIGKTKIDSFPNQLKKHVARRNFSGLSDLEKVPVIVKVLLDNNLTHEDIMPSVPGKIKKEHINKIMTSFGLAISKKNLCLIYTLISRQINNIKLLTLSHSRETSNFTSFDLDDKTAEGKNKSENDICDNDTNEHTNAEWCSEATQLESENMINSVSVKAQSYQFSPRRYRFARVCDKVSGIVNVLLENKLSPEAIRPSIPWKAKQEILHKILKSIGFAITPRNRSRIQSVVAHHFKHIEREFCTLLNKRSTALLTEKINATKEIRNVVSNDVASNSTNIISNCELDLKSGADINYKEDNEISSNCEGSTTFSIKWRDITLQEINEISKTSNNLSILGEFQSAKAVAPLGSDFSTSEFNDGNKNKQNNLSEKENITSIQKYLNSSQCNNINQSHLQESELKNTQSCTGFITSENFALSESSELTNYCGLDDNCTNIKSCYEKTSNCDVGKTKADSFENQLKKNVARRNFIGMSDLEKVPVIVKVLLDNNLTHEDISPSVPRKIKKEHINKIMTSFGLAISNKNLRLIYALISRKINNIKLLTLSHSRKTTNFTSFHLDDKTAEGKNERKNNICDNDTNEHTNAEWCSEATQLESENMINSVSVKAQSYQFSPRRYRFARVCDKVSGIVNVLLENKLSPEAIRPSIPWKAKQEILHKILKSIGFAITPRNRSRIQSVVTHHFKHIEREFCTLLKKRSTALLTEKINATQEIRNVVPNVVDVASNSTKVISTCKLGFISGADINYKEDNEISSNCEDSTTFSIKRRDITLQEINEIPKTSNNLSIQGEFQFAKVVAPLGSDLSASEFNAKIESKQNNLSEKENNITSIQRYLNSSQCNNINQSHFQESELKNTQSTSCTGFITSENFALSESSVLTSYCGLNDNCTNIKSSYELTSNYDIGKTRVDSFQNQLKKHVARKNFRAMSEREKVPVIVKVLLDNNLSHEDIMPSVPGKIKKEHMNKIMTSFGLAISNKNLYRIYALISRQINNIKFLTLSHSRKTTSFTSFDLDDKTAEGKNESENNVCDNDTNERTNAEWCSKATLKLESENMINSVSVKAQSYQFSPRSYRFASVCDKISGVVNALLENKLSPEAIRPSVPLKAKREILHKILKSVGLQLTPRNRRRILFVITRYYNHIEREFCTLLKNQSTALLTEKINATQETRIVVPNLVDVASNSTNSSCEMDCKSGADINYKEDNEISRNCEDKSTVAKSCFESISNNETGELVTDLETRSCRFSKKPFKSMFASEKVSFIANFLLEKKLSPKDIRPSVPCQTKREHIDNIMKSFGLKISPRNQNIFNSLVNRLFYCIEHEYFSLIKKQNATLSIERIEIILEEVNEIHQTNNNLSIPGELQPTKAVTLMGSDFSVLEFNNGIKNGFSTGPITCETENSDSMSLDINCVNLTHGICNELDGHNNLTDEEEGIVSDGRYPSILTNVVHSMKRFIKLPVEEKVRRVATSLIENNISLESIKQCASYIEPHEQMDKMLRSFDFCPHRRSRRVLHDVIKCHANKIERYLLYLNKFKNHSSGDFFINEMEETSPIIENVDNSTFKSGSDFFLSDVQGKELDNKTKSHDILSANEAMHPDSEDYFGSGQYNDAAFKPSHCSDIIDDNNCSLYPTYFELEKSIIKIKNHSQVDQVLNETEPLRLTEDHHIKTTDVESQHGISINSTLKGQQTIKNKPKSDSKSYSFKKSRSETILKNGNETSKSNVSLLDFFNFDSEWEKLNY